MKISRIVKRVYRRILKKRIRSTSLFRLVNPIRYPFYRKFYPKFDFKEIRELNSISHEFKFAYFHVPKAANSTIRYNLFLGVGNPPPGDASNRKAVFGNLEDQFDKAFRLNKSQLKDFEKHYFKFSFVRNPVDRIISAYLEKIFSSKMQKKVVSDYFERGVDKDITIDEFISYLEDGGVSEDMHWARQTDLLTMPVSKFDYIGKIETFQSDFAFVQKQIFGIVTPIVEWRFHSSEKLRPVRR